MFLKWLKQLWKKFMSINELELKLPQQSNDRIIKTIEGSIVISQEIVDITLTTAYEFDVPTGISDTTLVEGLFALAQFNQYQSIDSGIDTLAGEFVYLSVKSKKDFLRFYLICSSASLGRVVKYKVMLIAKKNQGIVDVADVEYKTVLTSKRNYRKIYKDEVVEISLPNGVGLPGGQYATFDLVVPHDLNYYPAVKESFEINDTIMNMYAVPAFVGNYYLHTIVGTKDIQFKFSSLSAAVKFKFHYRIYYDEH